MIDPWPISTSLEINSYTNGNLAYGKDTFQISKGKNELFYTCAGTIGEPSTKKSNSE